MLKIELKFSDEEIRPYILKEARRIREFYRNVIKYAKNTRARKQANKYFKLADYLVGRLIFFKDEPLMDSIQKTKEYKRFLEKGV